MKAVSLGLVLVLIAFVVAWRQRLEISGELAIAVLRAGVQLSLVATVIDAVFEHLGYAGLFVIVMFVAATWTAARRLGRQRQGWAIAGLGIAAGVLPALALLFGFGGFPVTPRYLIPVAGILIGGCMTATALAGRRIWDELDAKSMEVEARLSLGVSAPFALRSYLPISIQTALIPVRDQTKNVGLVTLPGAFVGMILGGASVPEAAQLQLTVLFSLLGAQTVAATVAANWMARSFLGPGESLRLPTPPANAQGK